MTFTKGATSITITRVVYPLEVECHYLDVIGEAEDGGVVAFDHAAKIYKIKFSILADGTLKNSLKSFYEDIVKGRTLPFTIQPDAGVDIGAGAGVTVNSARIWEITFRYRMAAYDFFNIELVIRHLGL